jgi:aminopeptidase N
MTTPTPSIIAPQLGGIIKATFDYAEHGGAVGDIALDLKLPDNAIVYQGLIDVVTDPTSGGSATVALKIEGSAIASVTGQLDTVPDGTAANVVKLTAERTLTVTVTTAALTAGKFHVYLTYFLSE